MQVVRTVSGLRAALAGRQDIVLVPTMGNLHEGHLSLLDIAATRGGCVVTSIFVNRLQFAPHEDFDEYPRTLERDCALLERTCCDVVFAPTEAEIYPEPQTCRVVPAPDLAEILEGRARPGFFTGVCTVVLKLFNLVGPSVAIFGKKDYQQLLVIDQLIRQLALPIELIAADTIREPSGLARSSRNAYLTAEQRLEAPQLITALRALVADAHATGRDFGVMERNAHEALSRRGWQVDYLAVRDRRSLAEPVTGMPLVALGAATLGRTRLIDSLEF